MQSKDWASNQPILGPLVFEESKWNNIPQCVVEFFMIINGKIGEMENGNSAFRQKVEQNISKQNSAINERFTRLDESDLNYNLFSQTTSKSVNEMKIQFQNLYSMLSIKLDQTISNNTSEFQRINHIIDTNLKQSSNQIFLLRKDVDSLKDRLSEMKNSIEDPERMKMFLKKNLHFQKLMKESEELDSRLGAMRSEMKKYSLDLLLKSFDLDEKSPFIQQKQANNPNTANTANNPNTANKIKQSNDLSSIRISDNKSQLTSRKDSVKQQKGLEAEQLVIQETNTIDQDISQIVQGFLLAKIESERILVDEKKADNQTKIIKQIANLEKRILSFAEQLDSQRLKDIENANSVSLDKKNSSILMESQINTLSTQFTTLKEQVDSIEKRQNEQINNIQVTVPVRSAFLNQASACLSEKKENIIVTPKKKNKDQQGTPKSSDSNSDKEYVRNIEDKMRIINMRIWDLERKVQQGYQIEQNRANYLTEEDRQEQLRMQAISKNHFQRSSNVAIKEILVGKKDNLAVKIFQKSQQAYRRQRQNKTAIGIHSSEYSGLHNTTLQDDSSLNMPGKFKNSVIACDIEPFQFQNSSELSFLNKRNILEGVNPNYFHPRSANQIDKSVYCTDSSYEKFQNNTISIRQLQAQNKYNAQLQNSNRCYQRLQKESYLFEPLKDFSDSPRSQDNKFLRDFGDASSKKQHHLTLHSPPGSSLDPIKPEIKVNGERLSLNSQENQSYKHPNETIINTYKIAKNVMKNSKIQTYRISQGVTFDALKISKQP